MSELPSSIAVVGLGLIGASLCRALRAAAPQLRLVGVARRRETAVRALADGICDRSGTDPALLAGVEVVVLCTPVDVMPEWFDACARLAPDALVTDCGSTKAWLVDRAAVMLEGRFLGGHPMAGRERSGYEAADPELFAGCTWVVTPDRKGLLERFSAWLAVIEALGARLEVVDAATHDLAVAWISHLPLLLSSALVRASTEAAPWPVAGRLAASGFRDMARLAGGDPTMAAAIALTNAPAIRAALDGIAGELDRVRALLDDDRSCRDWFSEARAARTAWLEDRQRRGRPVG